MTNKILIRTLALFTIVLFTLTFVYAEESTSETDTSLETNQESGPVLSASDEIHGVDPNKAYLFGNSASEQGKISTSGLFQTDLFTGAATYLYQIKVLPGTNGLQPSINLIYNSHNTNKRPSKLGAAWELDQVYIQRDVNYTPSDTSDDKFKLFFQGKEYELVYSNGIYHTKIESFLYINKQGNDWIVKTKDGTEYEFSYKQNSNQYNYIWRWYLEKVIDTHNNNIYYSYQENPFPNNMGAVYLDKIEYNNDKKRKIEFIYESYDRPDIWTVYEQGNKIKETRRLKEIRIKANSDLINKYVLEYDSLDAPAYSFLISVKSYGKDSSFLETKFEYYPLQKEWESSNIFTPSYYVDDDLRRKKFPDGEYHNYGVFGIDQGIRLDDINRNGIFEETNGFADEYGDKTGKLLGDVNGDGLIDTLVAHKNKNRESFINTGNGFEVDNKWIPPVDFVENLKVGDISYYGYDRGVRLADVNNDGLIDIIDGSPNGKTWVNTGNGWEINNKWQPIPFTDLNGDKGARLADINGDGLVDIILSLKVREDMPPLTKIYINNGEKWQEDNSWNFPEYFIESDGTDTGVRLADINGDGLVDIIKSSEKNGKLLYLNTGNGWKSYSWDIPVYFVEDKQYKVDVEGGQDYIIKYPGVDTGVRLADVNGDGLTDLLFGNEDESPYKAVWLNKAEKAYLIKNIYNDLGGITSIDYKKSTSFDNTGDDDISDLGFNIWVVNSIISNNGMQASHKVISTTAYSYEGGLYDYKNKEFRGFAYVQETRLDGSSINHYFHQDDAKKSLEYKTEILDNKENPYKKIEQNWNSVTKNNYYIITLEDAATETYDGNNNNPKIKKISYDYDEYGNIIRIEDLDKYEYYEYNNDINKWIFKPNHYYLKDSNNKISESFYTYNDYGDLIKEEHWLNNGNNPIIQYTYDSYGNLKTETDPNRHTTTYYYDATNTFPIKMINAKNQEYNYEYDLMGNLLSETDPNGYKTEYKYDSLGRIIRKILPYDSDSYPTIWYTYDTNGISPEMIKIAYTEDNGDQNTFDEYYFYDGFGRLIQSRIEGESNQIIQDNYYDSSGRMYEKSNPYFASFSASYTSPNSVPNTLYFYDSLDRIIKIRNPDNTETNINYDHWTVSIYDENNHRKDYINDAYGRIIQVKEYNNNQIYTTNYRYDAADNLIEIQNNQNNKIKYTYDSLGRKIKLEDPDLGIWTYYYDQNGNLIKQIDAKGNSILMNYDELNRIRSKNNINYYYDEIIGTLSKITSPQLTTKYYYDNRLRTIKEEKIIDGKTFITSLSYDPMDRIISKTLPNNEVMQFSYNAGNKLESIGNIISNINYNEIGQPILRKYANNLQTELTYDSTNFRLTKKKTLNLQELNYNYDNAGNVLEIDNLISNKKETMRYDDLDRLIHAERTNDFSLNYEYDSIGNMLKISNNLGNNLMSSHIVLASASDQIDLGSGIVEEKEPEEETEEKNQFTISLKQGLNLISIPLTLDDNSIDIVLKPIQGKYNSVFAYIDEGWKIYNPERPLYLNTLTEITPEYGYWIEMKENAALTLTGLEINSYTFNLDKGWNLIGYPFLESGAIDSNLPNLINIFVYESGFKEYDPLKQSNLNTLKEFKQGYGYWVRVSEDTEWTID